MNINKQILSKTFDIQQYGLPFSKHNQLGEALIQKGKTKKMKIYTKGFTFNSLFNNRIIYWEDILKVNFEWEEYTVNLSGREKLELNFTLKNGDFFSIVFRSPIIMIPLDLSSKNENILKILKYCGSIYGFKVGKYFS